MQIVKRLLDFVLSLTLLIIFFPLMLLVAFFIRIKLGSPVFFKQVRPGKNGKLFTMIKFRSMLDLRDENGKFLEDSRRLTAFGRLLRSTSIDELPELFNVAKGDMSIVGPRPLFVEYLPIYNERQGRRHEVKPGITGWAQVNGRNSITWAEKFELDVWYIDNWSLWLDIKIIFLTVFKVIKRDNINLKEDKSAEYFNGSN